MSHIEFPFLAFPQALLYSERLRRLKPNSKLLYMLLLDRMNLSEINRDTYSDEKGLFVYCTINEAGKILGCDRTTVIRAMKELREEKLIISEEQKKNTPDKIRVITPPELFIRPRLQNATTEWLQNTTTGGCKTPPQVVAKCDPNHTYNNHTDNSHTYPLQAEDDEITRKIKEQIEYECLPFREGEQPIADELIMLMADMMACRNREMHIGSNVYTAEHVRGRLARLDSESFMNVVYSVVNNRTKVKDPDAYMRKLLFSAPATYNSSVAMDFGHDFG